MKVKKISDDIIRQLFLILLIGFIGIVIIYYLKYFIPGVLGAITLYILFRKGYFRLTEQRKWNKSLTSALLMFITLITIAVPVWLIVEILIPQISSLLANRQIIVEKFNAVKAFMASKPLLNRINLSEENLLAQLQKVTTYIPRILNSVAEIFVNIATAFFILYFMQVSARNMEKRISLYLPFSPENKDRLWAETNMMVRSNALGIPILAVCQGLVAVAGYWIFGVRNPFLWGMLTGAASVVPAVGTMIVWVPICIVQFATGENITNAILLTIYCLVVVGGIDNILRFTILKKIGNVHPLITVFGVLLGLNLFGIMGLIFGPLLLSYFSLLTKIYRTEFGKKQKLMVVIKEQKSERAEADKGKTEEPKPPPEPPEKQPE